MIVAYGQDIFQQLEPAPTAAAAVGAAPSGVKVNPSFFATAVAAGVTTWLITRFLDRLLHNRKR